MRDSFAQLADLAIFEAHYLTGLFKLDFQGNAEYLTKDGSLILEKEKVIINGKEYKRGSGKHVCSISNFIVKKLKLHHIYLQL